mmetsp:Transcript_30242/g.71206  ORF Transcript_30242/g.71206 Transcript_30242/m.71206 type:complete len:273 (+) Transcript_30242:79-897(+)
MSPRALINKTQTDLACRMFPPGENRRKWPEAQPRQLKLWQLPDSRSGFELTQIDEIACGASVIWSKLFRDHFPRTMAFEHGQALRREVPCGLPAVTHRGASLPVIIARESEENLLADHQVPAVSLTGPTNRARWANARGTLPPAWIVLRFIQLVGARKLCQQFLHSQRGHPRCVAPLEKHVQLLVGVRGLAIRDLHVHLAVKLNHQSFKAPILVSCVGRSAMVALPDAPNLGICKRISSMIQYQSFEHDCSVWRVVRHVDVPVTQLRHGGRN